MSLSPSKHPSLAWADVDKELPDAPIVLKPLRKNQPSPFFNASRWGRDSPNPRLTFNKQRGEPLTHGRLRRHFPLPALVTALLVFILATILLLYLTVFQRVPNLLDSDRSAVFVSEPTDALLGLAISTVSTHIVSISVPFLVLVAAYCVAGVLLRDQELCTNPQTFCVHPTPLQYAFMFKLLAIPNVSSVYQAGQYMQASNGIIRVPRAFRLALGLASLILGLSYALILTDVWLHAASAIIEGNLTTDALRSGNAATNALGVAFNQSVCTSSPARPCLNDTGGWAATQPWIAQSGLRIAVNDGLISVVTLTNGSDLLAVVVPPLPISDSDDSSTLTVFEAPSFGIKAQCANLTPNCTTAGSITSLPTLCFENESLKTLAASVNTSTSTNGTTPSSTSTAPNPSSTSIASPQSEAHIRPLSSTPENPQTVVLQLQWSVNGTLVPKNPTATAQTNNTNAILAWATCGLTFYNLTLRHQDGNYSVAGAPIVADVTFAGLMQSGLLSQLGNLQLLSNLQATMLAAPTEAAALTALNEEVGHLALALFAGTLQPAPATSALITTRTLLGRYHIAPVTLYLLLMYTYALTACTLFIWATRLRGALVRAPGRKAASAVQLTQLRLTDPLTLIAALYPGPGPSPAGSPEDPRELFLEEGERGRLEVGTRQGADGRPVFGVHRRAAPWTVLEMG